MEKKQSGLKKGGGGKKSDKRLSHLRGRLKKGLLKNKTESNYYSSFDQVNKVKAASMHMSTMYQTLAMFYLHDDESTFWTLQITDETSAWEACRKIEEKLQLKSNFDCVIRLYERTRAMYSVDRLVEDSEVINKIRAKWEEEDRVEKSLFVVRVIQMSRHPTRQATHDRTDSSGPMIISFLPDKVISRYLFSAGEPPTKPLREAFPAAVMFVDIAGFTAFTENLLKEGGDMGTFIKSVFFSVFFPLCSLLIERTFLLERAINIFQSNYISFCAIFRSSNLATDDV